MSGSPSLTRPLAPNTIHLDMDSGTKYYHLVSVVAANLSTITIG